MSATETPVKRVAYYKGCLASLSAKELDSSTQALAPMVGLELVELESVTCCGAGDIHEAEPDYYLHLNARILAYAEATGCDMLMTVCNVCTLNLRQANFMLQGDADLLARVNENLATVGVPAYSGNVEVRHFLWEIAEGDGYERLKEAAHRGLKGLKVAPFYGCQILRPSKIMGFEDPDRPWSLERIIEACGGEAIDYPAKVKCCGFPIIAAREETALGEVIQPIEQAIEAGADVMVTPCPLCHLSLDAWQQKLEASTGPRVPDADPPPRPARRSGGRPRGSGAEVQAPHRRPAAGARAAGSLGGRAAVRRRRRRPRLGPARGRVGAVQGAGARAAGAAAGAGRRPDRPSLGLPLRRPVAGDRRRLAGGRLGPRAEAGPRRGQRRPPDPSAGRADASRELVRVLPRPNFVVLGNHDIALSRDPQARRSDLRELEPATLLRDEGRAARAAGPDRVDRRRRPAADRAGRRGSTRTGSPERPTSRSCSATTRACSTCSSRDASTSCSPATCTTARSRFRSRAGRSASRIRPRASTPASTGRRRRRCTSRAGLGTTFVPFRFAARPEATELVLQTAG